MLKSCCLPCRAALLAGCVLLLASDQAPFGAVLRAETADLASILEPGQPSSSVALSPDGRRLAFATRKEGRLYLHVRDLEASEENEFEVGVDLPANNEHVDPAVRPATMDYVGWPTDTRIVFQQRYGKLWGIDPDGSNKVELLRFSADGFDGSDKIYESRTVINLLKHEPDVILVRGSFSALSNTFHRFSAGSLSDYYRVDIHRGTAMPFSGYDGMRERLLVDQLGRVRAAYAANDKDGGGELLVCDDRGVPKVRISKLIGEELAEKYGLRSTTLSHLFKQARIFGFGYRPDLMFFASNAGRNTYAIYALDLTEKEVVGPLAESDTYDVPTALVYVPQRMTLGGIRYEDERPRTIWLVPELENAQGLLDRALPNRTNHIRGWSDDLSSFLVVSSSDRDPGSVYLLDLKSKKLARQLALRPAVDPKAMATSVSAWVPTRDGRKILCYLTVPGTVKPGSSNPMVVLLHGGPWARDTWGFDPEVQSLAARGFLVLQVNFRGSEGFGYEHLSAAFGRFGDSALEDVEDAIDWAVDYGLADKQRLFVMGASYGGYLALYVAAANPDLFRGVVARAPVTDLFKIIDGESHRGVDWLGSRVRRALIGDPRKDKDLLQKTSPVNLASKITAPVLLIHGKEDRVVPFEHSERMAARLKSAKRDVKFVVVKDAYHGGFNPDQERMAAEETIGFLQRLDPGPPAATPAP